MPAWKTLFLSLQETPPAVLTRFSTAVGWALRVLQAERLPVEALEHLLAEAMVGLEGLPEEQAGQWVRVAWFFVLLISHRRKERELMDVIFEKAQESKFREREEITDAGPTIAQTIAAEARAEGEAWGLRTALQRVMQVRFGEIPAKIEAAIAGAGSEALDRWLTRALTAASIDETGIATDSDQ